MKIKEVFDKYDSEFLEFNRVETKFSNRRDLHAFILLDRLFPGTKDIVSAAEHDQIFLSISPDELNKVATEEQLIELHRCGVRYDSYFDSLAMFV